MSSFNNLENEIIMYGRKQALIDSAPLVLDLRLSSDELDSVVQFADVEGIKKSVGEIGVDLILLCEAYGLDFKDCLKAAFEAEKALDNQGKPE